MKFNELLYKILNNVCRVFLLGMVLVTSYVVIGRYVFDYTPGWGEEVALLCMTWFGMLSAAMAEQRNAHIRVSAMDNIYPKLMVKILHKFYYLVKLIFALVLVVEGTKLMIQYIPVRMVGIPISEAWTYLSGPVTGITMLIILLSRFREEILQ